MNDPAQLGALDAGVLNAGQGGNLAMSGSGGPIAGDAAEPGACVLPEGAADKPFDRFLGTFREQSDISITCADGSSVSATLQGQARVERGTSSDLVRTGSSGAVVCAIPLNLSPDGTRAAINADSRCMLEGLDITIDEWSVTMNADGNSGTMEGGAIAAEGFEVCFMDVTGTITRTGPAPICAPQTDAEFCASYRNCGCVAAPDNCGAVRAVQCGELGDLRCNAQQPQRCGDDGLWQDQDQACVDMACVEGECTGECTPGATQCTDSQLQRCGPDGEWEEPQACEIGPCIDGTCAAVCDPGEQRCTGSTQPQRCGTDGQWENRAACVDQVCVDGECTGECSAGATDCTDLGMRTCNADGTWGVASGACGTLSYPSDLPAYDLTVDSNGSRTIEVRGVLAGTTYTVALSRVVPTDNDVDLYVYGTAAQNAQLCSGTTTRANESCSATPSGDTLYVRVVDYGGRLSTFSLDVVPLLDDEDAGVLD